MDRATKLGSNFKLDKLFVAGFVIYLIIGWYLSVSEFSNMFFESCKQSKFNFIINTCQYVENASTTRALSIIFFLFGCYIWLMLIYFVNNENTKNRPAQYDLSSSKLGLSSISSFLSNISILVVVVGLLLLLILAVLHILGKWSNATNSILSVLNILNVITILSIIYIYFLKEINWGETPNSIGSLVKNVIFYIPCIFMNMVDSVTGEYKRTPTKAVKLLLIESAIVTVYFLLPILIKFIKSEFGNVLLEGPVYLNNQYTLGSYQSLTKRTNEAVTRRSNDNSQQIIYSTSNNKKNLSDKKNKKTELNINLKPFNLGDREIMIDNAPQKWPARKMPVDKYNYTYAISSWIYINPQPPSTNQHYSKFTRLLDYGSKPTINYKGKTNTIQVTVKTNDKKDKIIYEDSTFPLQKWNHVLINYDGGTLDIFINNELVSSTASLIPYMSNDIIYSGVDNGIHGGISNVIYFDDVLDKNEISLLYQTRKI
jgi:hypothetical protein